MFSNSKRFLTASFTTSFCLFFSCANLGMRDRSMMVNDKSVDLGKIDGYWLLSKVRYGIEGRLVEDIRTQYNTAIIGVDKGTVNAFKAEGVVFYCNPDGFLSVQRNLFIQLQGGSCLPTRWVLRELNSDVLIIHDFAWFEGSQAIEADLEFIKTHPREAAKVMYRSVLPENVKGFVFNALKPYRTELQVE